MEQREIILTPFPFSNLEKDKVRPSIIISNDNYNKKFEDIIVVPLTSNLKIRDYSILLTNKDLEKGKIITESKIKADKIFSINKKLVRLIIGKISKEKFYEIKEMIFGLL
jgi:mRNA interferase MazF